MEISNGVDNSGNRGSLKRISEKSENDNYSSVTIADGASSKKKSRNHRNDKRKKKKKSDDLNESFTFSSKSELDTARSNSDDIEIPTIAMTSVPCPIVLECEDEFEISVPNVKPQLMSSFTPMERHVVNLDTIVQVFPRATPSSSNAKTEQVVSLPPQLSSTQEESSSTAAVFSTHTSDHSNTTKFKSSITLPPSTLTSTSPSTESSEPPSTSIIPMNGQDSVPIINITSYTITPSYVEYIITTDYTNTMGASTTTTTSTTKNVTPSPLIYTVKHRYNDFKSLYTQLISYRSELNTILAPYLTQLKIYYMQQGILNPSALSLDTCMWQCTHGSYDCVQPLFKSTTATNSQEHTCHDSHEEDDDVKSYITSKTSKTTMAKDHDHDESRTGEINRSNTPTSTTTTTTTTCPDNEAHMYIKPLVDVPHLPPSHYLYGYINGKDEEFIRTRQQDLYTWLQEIIYIPLLWEKYINTVLYDYQDHCLPTTTTTTTTNDGDNTTMNIQKFHELSLSSSSSSVSSSTSVSPPTAAVVTIHTKKIHEQLIVSSDSMTTILKNIYHIMRVFLTN